GIWSRPSHRPSAVGAEASRTSRRAPAMRRTASPQPSPPSRRSWRVGKGMDDDHPAGGGAPKAPAAGGRGTGPAAWVRGRRLAVDVGSVRIGVATCDPDGILATPVETVARAKKDHAGASDVRRIAALVDEYEAVEVVVGLPRTLRGTEGRA